MSEKEYKTFEEFYPYYLNEHRQLGTRITHFIGTTLFLGLLITAIVRQQWVLLPISIVCAYGFAWIGHFFIEKNKPATFKYPWMSLKGDFKLYFEILLGKQGFRGN
ncbi:MAG: DUF962 domain-containing protein [Bacteroidia bacterium]|jgi:hypothetical protein